VTVEDLPGGGGAGLGSAPSDDLSIDAFVAACRRVDSDPKERQRIRDLANAIEEEDAAYRRATAALEEGDIATAVPLLRQASRLGIGEAHDLLAELRGQRTVGRWRTRRSQAA